MCTSSSDTICKQCSKCEKLEFVSQKCEAGKDAVCDSCKYCTFIDDFMAQSCKTENYFSWHQDNCCSSKDGNKVHCRMVPWKDMQILSTTGKHTLVFDHTSPPVIPTDLHITPT
jgi:hypothetical protein